MHVHKYYFDVKLCLHSCIGGWTKTASGEEFLIAEDGQGEQKIIICATDRNVILLCETKTIYVDGTFETCPRLFYQAFKIHAFKNEKQFMLGYCLLPEKTRATYVRMFKLVKEKAVSLSLSLDPEIVLGDFEQAIKQAVDLCFLTAEFMGCYFHFSQALMRKFQAIGLQQAYRSDYEACKF